VHATFSRQKREELRAQGRLRNRLSGVLTPMLPGGLTQNAGASSAAAANANANRGYTAAPVRDDELGEYLGTVRSARSDRDEISRLLATIPANEKARIANVAGTAVELVGKIESIAGDLARTDRELGGNRAATMDAEIAALEAEANPLDTQRSEGRVRRLAQLRRDRRSLADALRKRETRRGQLESCRIALENVRLDLVRLRTGNSSPQSVTQVAEQAMALARDVDIAVSAANEVRDATRSRPSGSPA
jgi:serine/threonine-protein kinase